MPDTSGTQQPRRPHSALHSAKTHTEPRRAVEFTYVHFSVYMFPFRLAMMKHTSNHPDHSSAPPNLEKLENYPDLFARKTIELNGKRSRKMLWILLEM
ncbi:type VI secretion system protein TssN [Burkholderia pseudomallei]|uniref:type VI secretion system protein TssN n=1 Tax=Burkholderia pseudomallei TaxID=28450 RepID=UPI0005729169|nr:type VI secretion system protein TssN [Burkholderia pseudomallei]